MTAPDPLPPGLLYRRCDLDALAFDSTDELGDIAATLGQDRAVEALRFGAAMTAKGYNLFVLGPSGIGKHSVTRDFLETRAHGESVPPDRAYLYNFDDPNAPRLLTLAAGRGRRFAADLDSLCEELRSAIPAVFESDEYRNRVQELHRTFGKRQEQAIREIQQAAEAQDIALILSQTGFTFAPRSNGETLDPESFQKLPQAEQDRIEHAVEALQDRLQTTLQQFPKWRKESQQQLESLNEEMAQLAVGQVIADLRERYADLSAAVAHLDAVRRDVVENVDWLRQAERMHDDGPIEPLLQRYRANVIVDHGEREGAPVVYENLPTYNHLIGRIEHRVMQGALLTDFSLVRAGALHRANGGYLVLDALELLRQPFAWDALKRTLAAGEIRIESLEQSYSIMSTVSLQPEPVPLDLKVVLLGDRMLYYLLAAYDPDFPDLFKVQADFEDDLERDADSQAQYARLIATLARRASVRPLDRSGVARVIEHGSRLADDSERLSMHGRSLVDLLNEADHFAGEAEAARIGQAHVQAAIDAQERRASRVRERMERAIQRDTIRIETSGAVVGQVNGLAVMQFGGYAFGKGSRITATARLGHGQLIDIERRAQLGGNIHSKAVMIIGNFIGARYAADRPLSLHASLAFEQNYGGVEGDSASVAEVCALLSAIAGVGLSQALAVTGSIDQLGRVQAVGGVNEKIEGFFETCARRGFADGQGVLLPRANVPHLMLRAPVREAVEAGRFRVVPLDHVDDAIELLTGMPVGERDAEGVYPSGTFNRLVDERLAHLAEVRRHADHDHQDGDDAEPGREDEDGHAAPCR
jgi:lon-related putative ATP-dependent protease